MNKMLLAAAVLGSSALASSASASNGFNGYVYGFAMLSNGTVTFNTDGTRTTAPSCQASGSPQRWAIDASTAAGQARLSTLLTAYSLHKQINVYGTGSCSLTSDSESVNFFTTDGL